MTLLPSFVCEGNTQVFGRKITYFETQDISQMFLESQMRVKEEDKGFIKVKVHTGGVTEQI